MFWLTLAIQLVKVVIYTVWGSGDIQPFDNPDPAHAKEKNCDMEGTYARNEITNTR